MNADTENLTGPACYQLLTGAVVPRPIAWISTLSADGVANLAPFSFFTVASVFPRCWQSPRSIHATNRKRHPCQSESDTGMCGQRGQSRATH